MRGESEPAAILRDAARKPARLLRMRFNLLKHNNLMLRSERRERLEAWAASDSVLGTGNRDVLREPEGHRAETSRAVVHGSSRLSERRPLLQRSRGTRALEGLSCRRGIEAEGAR